MKELLERINGLSRKFDKELADSVLEVSIRANKQIIEELRGDESMCEALLEIMRPEVEIIAKESEKKGKEKGRAEGEAKALMNVILQMKQKEFSSKEIANILDKEEAEIEAVLSGKEIMLI